MKTNATRILETLGIEFTVREYEVDPDDLGAEKVAAAIGMPAEQVFKTLVLRGDRNGVCLAVIPADAELDLKATAKLSGNRKVAMVPLKDVQPLTGYVRGGVTAFGCKKPFPVYAAEEIGLYDEIAVSAGARGQQLVLAPDDYIGAADATLGELIRY